MPAAVLVFVTPPPSGQNACLALDACFSRDLVIAGLFLAVGSMIDTLLGHGMSTVSIFAECRRDLPSIVRAAGFHSAWTEIVLWTLQDRQQWPFKASPQLENYVIQPQYSCSSPLAWTKTSRSKRAPASAPRDPEASLHLCSDAHPLHLDF